jgi:hypothetical protein
MRKRQVPVVLCDEPMRRENTDPHDSDNAGNTTARRSFVLSVPS